MAQKRKLPFLLRILLPPVLALAVLWGGSFCANALLDSQGGPKAKELLLQTGEEIRSANQLLFEKKTYQIICDYSIAFLDSAIAFDFLPNYDIGGLWGLIQHLPRNVQIEKIWFSYNAVSFSVSTDSPQQLMVLLEYLQSSEQYSTVFFYQIWKEKKTDQEYLNKLVAPLIRGYYVDEEFEKRILKRESQQSTFVNKEFAFPHTTNQLSQHIVLSVGLITDQGLAETGGNGVIFLFAIPEEMTAEVENELFELYDILFELIKMGIDEFIELAPTQESFLKLIKSKGERLHE